MDAKFLKKYLSISSHFDDYVPLFAPCGFILVTLIMLINSNTEEMLNWLKYHPFYSLPFQVVIPVAVLITGKIRNKVQKKKQVQKKATVKQSTSSKISPKKA